MTTNQSTPSNIDEYISGFPECVQAILKKVRMTIREAAPDAQETISYQIPTFKWKGNLVHFAGYKKHIGFYPAPSGIEKFEKELAGYQLSKGTIRFPIDKPIPYNLIGEIVRFRVKENLTKAEAKSKN